MASTIKVNTIEAQSSTDVNIPTGFKLKVADAGELYIGGVAITTGSQGVISKTATYQILAADFTGKSSLVVFVNVSAGTSTAANITLPAVADFSTCAIHVVSTAAHGSGNTVVIKLGALEQYTLLKKGDHCEFVSDGTNVFRTGNEFVTAAGFIFRNANKTLGAGATEVMFTTGTDTVKYDLGSWWNSTTFAAEIPWDCRILVEANTPNYSDNNYISLSIKRYYSSRASNEWIYRLDDHIGNLTGHGPQWSFEYDFSTGDEISYEVHNEHGSAAIPYSGSANFYSSSYAKWTVVRRY